MTQKNLWEIAKIFGITILMLVIIAVEYWLFNSGILPVDAPSRKIWVENNFKPAVIYNFIWSVIWVFIWYFKVLKGLPSYVSKEHFGGYRVTWVLILLIFLLLGSALLSYFYGFKSSPRSILWFSGFLLGNTTLYYWVTTLISTPQLIRPTVPLGGFLPHK